MDEILTIRENEIKKLDKLVKHLNENIESKNEKLNEISVKLETTQAQLERVISQKTQERKIRTKISGVKEAQTHFSKSNERKDLNGNYLMI